MTRFHWLALCAAVLAVVVSSMELRANSQDIAAPYGKRLAPLPAGEGGDLIVTAPSELCIDASHELRLRRYLPPGNAMLYALRGPAGPSNCEWPIEGLREAAYDAVIVRRADGYIVATSAKTEVVRSGTTILRLEVAALEIEGRITVNGVVDADAQLVFRPNGFNEWRTQLTADGTYRLKLDGGESGSFCMYLERARTQTIGTRLVGCERFDYGLHRYDADVTLSPGVIRVDVVPFGKPVPNDWTSVVVVVKSARESKSSSGFRVTNGFRGEYVGGDYESYEVSVQTGPDHRILVRSHISLSAEQPIGSVRLVVPAGSLTCNDGWWSAC